MYFRAWGHAVPQRWLVGTRLVKFFFNININCGIYCCILYHCLGFGHLQKHLIKSLRVSLGGVNYVLQQLTTFRWCFLWMLLHSKVLLHNHNKINWENIKWALWDHINYMVGTFHIYIYKPSNCFSQISVNSLDIGLIHWSNRCQLFLKVSCHFC